MFKGILNSAKEAAGRLVLGYVARASVAIPFLIAVGFALAAITSMLVQRFGPVAAYWMIAGGLVAIGAIAALAVSVKEHQDEPKDEEATAADTSQLATEVASQLPLALLGSIFTIPGGSQLALGAARVAGRNWPLLALGGIVALLASPLPLPGGTLRNPLPNGRDHDAVLDRSNAGQRV